MSPFREDVWPYLVRTGYYFWKLTMILLLTLCDGLHNARMIRPKVHEAVTNASLDISNLARSLTIVVVRQTSHIASKKAKDAV